MPTCCASEKEEVRLWAEGFCGNVLEVLPEGFCCWQRTGEYWWLLRSQCVCGWFCSDKSVKSCRAPGSCWHWGLHVDTGPPGPAVLEAASGQCTQCPLLWPSGPHPEPCCRFKAEKFWRCCLLSLEPADEAWLILTALHTIRPVVTASRIWPVAIFVFPYLFRRVFCSLSDRSSDLQRLEPEQEQQSDKRWTIEHQSRSWEMWQD